MIAAVFAKASGHRRRLLIFCLAIPAFILPAFAQRDFLTPNEVDQIREVQEPVVRIKLYLSFAKQRLDQLQSLMVKNRPGRSGDVRQLLSDYSSIIEAIDTVSDDALQRKADLTAGPAAITAGEKKFLDQLTKIQESSPSDLDMYGFELKEAIATTSDSTDLANESLGARSRDVDSRAAKEKKQVANVNAAERKLDPDAPADQAEAAAADAAKPARKPPTLYRPGEKPADTQ